MTTSGDSSNQPGAQGDQPQSTGDAAQPVAPSDPTILRQPNSPDPQQDPTLLRSFDQPQGGLAAAPPPGQGYAQPGFAPQQQSGPGYAQPGAGQGAGPQDQGFAGNHGFAPGQGFAAPAQGFPPQDQNFGQQGFAAPGQGFPGHGQGFAPQSQGFPQGQNFAAEGQSAPQGQQFAAQDQSFAQGQGFGAQGQGFAAQGQNFPSAFGQGGPGGPGVAQPHAAFGPSGPSSPGLAGKGWLWGLGGVVLASAVWGAAVLAFGGFGGGSASSGVAPGEPDLRGYAYSDDFCDVVDTAPFTEAGYTVSTKDSSGKRSYPDFEGTEHPARDTMFCAQRFLPQGVDEDDYQDASMYSSVTIHKKSDPSPEFTAGFDTWRMTNPETSGEGRKEEISGIGDEAWVAIEPSTPGDTSPTVTLRVRDGWVIGYFTWSQYVSTSSSSSSRTTAKVLPESEVIDKLTESAKSTMAALRD
ncbi:hypothetical protein [Nocardia cyriacigeorgica]|uniref:Uncharacterized protein n=1 Tax=Nocardia cyriacigeorgica TaxID=135487 RepID=A0A5R8NP78_9NOCA|nr:hypothetical protein [Nocardia cyriacigeorgica]TLF77500.1 hypothetical protein FEK34_14315 [Nocardia cyriacigeorgica]